MTDVTATTGPAGAPQAAGPVHFFDDFSGGLATEGAEAGWDVRPAGPLPAGDGIVTTGPGGLTVIPTGRNERTGEPAFVPLPPGPADILRWAMFTRLQAPSGAPGVATPDAGALTVRARLSARMYGQDGHPFPDVTDAGTDLRLGAAALIVLDRPTRMIFDIILTRDRVMAIYERLPGADPADGTFSFVVPLAPRAQDDTHDVAISYDRAAGVVSWQLAGREVLRVGRVGLPVLDERHLLRGRTSGSELVRPAQLNAGVAMFSRGTWGQGVRLSVRSLSVTTTPALPAGPPPDPTDESED